MATTKHLQTQTASNIDLKITKEDIFLVMQVQKEEEIDEKIKTLELELQAVKEGKGEIRKNLEVIILKALKLHNIKDVEVDLDFAFLNYNCESIYIKDIEALSKLKNPKAAKCTKRHHFYTDYYFPNEICYTLSTNLHGATLTGGTTVSIKPTAEMNKLVKQFNKINDRKNEIILEINDLEYQKLLIYSDNSFKAAMIKKIVVETDVKYLLG